MIRGYFYPRNGRLRPFISATFRFPSLGDALLNVPLLVDTGADRTILSTDDAADLGIDPGSLPAGPVTRGVGGRMRSRIVDAVLTIGNYTAPLPLAILLTSPASVPVPSLLGRDVLSQFALFMEERTQGVLLLEPAEADRLAL